MTPERIIPPEFKALVAAVCRSEAAILSRQQRHDEAAAKIAAAERLERQVKESADVYA